MNRPRHEAQDSTPPQESSTAEPTKDDDERPVVPELDDFEEEELDDIFNKLQGSQ
jgi:hypothetical protein